MPQQSGAPARRRQWGAERRTQPLPSVHPRPSDRAVTLGRLAIIATVLFWAAYVITTIVRQFIDTPSVDFRFTMEAISYLIVVTFLTFSALMYLVARQGALQRFRDHVRVPRAELDRHFADGHGTMTVLVPSYAEEPDVIRGTLWSAALQEYPSLRVVLLLDDPPFPTNPTALARLEVSRALPAQITAELAEPAERFGAALLDAELAVSTGQSGTWTATDLAEHYRWASAWVREKAAGEKLDDHVDVFFVNEVLITLADDLELVADALDAAIAEGTTPDDDRMLELHRRLLWTFSAEVVRFERKAYASLSHEANKAMNLNSYLGLMGGSFRLDPSDQ